MPDALRKEELQTYFSNISEFDASDLHDFYKEFGEELNPNTLLSRIYNLKQKGIIASKKRGIFTLGNRSLESYIIDKSFIELSSNLRKQFPHIRHSVWSTALLDTLSNTNSSSEYILIETDKQAAESVFDELKINGPGIFLAPDSLLLERYVPMFEKPIIIQPLISEAPLESRKGVLYPSPEKIMVDLICDTTLYSNWQGTVLRKIFATLHENTILNKSALFRYARRRNREDELFRILRSLNIILK